MTLRPPWLEVAEAELRDGVTEITGPEHNPRILEYHETTTLKATDDETPWCAAFVCWCFQMAGYPHTHSARARDYLLYGLELPTPAHGCVGVFQRGSGPQPGAEILNAPGHVGFLVGMASPGELLVLGGNQGNRVSTQVYPLARLLSCRWPSGV